MKKSLKKRFLLIIFIIKIGALTFSYCQAGTETKSPLHTIDGKIYIALKEFAKNQSVRTEFYDHNNKLVLRFPSKKTVVSAYCSFIKIEDTVYQLPYPVLFDGKEFYIAAESFSDLLNFENLSDVSIKVSESVVIATAPQYNIHSVEFAQKLNGSQIKINTSQTFDTRSFGVSFSRGGWMNMTIPGGKPDSISVTESKVQEPVVRIRSMQSDQSCQLSFLLRYQIDDYDLVQKDNQIIVTLRTNITDNAQKIKEMRNRWLLDTIVIDAGHGGKDSGTIGITSLMEKTVTLDIAKKLGKMIEREMGVNVVYTREEDVFIPLWKRTKIANESGGKVFVSIHANSTSRASSAKGFETFLLRPGKTEDAIEVASRENSVIALEENIPDFAGYKEDNIILATMAQSSFMQESEFLAATIQTELDKILRSNNRGVKQAGFQVLVGASMPNVLVEVGFLSNKTECKNLGKSSYRKKVARAIFNSLIIFKDKYESPIIGSQ